MPKKNISISFSAPVTILFAIICATVFALHNSSYQYLFESLFTVGGNSSSIHSFNFTSPIDYITLFTHVFGHNSWYILSINLICILLLGSKAEEDYGAGLLLLMYCICAFISGVLSTLLVPTYLLGSQGIVILLLLLHILSSAKAKIIPFNILFICIIYLIAMLFYSSPEPVIVKIIPMIGALCASILGFVDFFDYTKKVPRKRRSSVQKNAMP